MDKYEYAQEVCKYVNQYGFETEITDNYRNNGSYVAITVKSDDSSVSPVFSVGEETEEPIEFAKRIMSFIPEKVDTKILADIMTDKEEVLKRVNYILVNSELNRSRESLVRTPINQTLELQYKVDISDIINGARVTIEHKHKDRLGISEQELYDRAYANTMEMYPPKIANITDLIPIQMEELPMYVLTNTSSVYGAGAILYSGMKKTLEKLVGEFIVIPSSVHEMIIIPTYLGECNTLTNMIREVNTTTVSPEEVLSDRPYELVSDGVLFEV